MHESSLLCGAFRIERLDLAIHFLMFFFSGRFYHLIFKLVRNTHIFCFTLCFYFQRDFQFSQTELADTCRCLMIFNIVCNTNIHQHSLHLIPLIIFTLLRPCWSFQKSFENQISAFRPLGTCKCIMDITIHNLV